MKACLLTFCGSFVLVGAAWAAGAACDGPPTGGATTDEAAGCCAGSCGTSACKVCVPEATKKKKDKVAYSSKCVDFCVPKPSLHGVCSAGACGGNGDCNACAAQAGVCQACGGAGCIKCGRVRTKKVLIKKVKSIESDTYKCVPRSVCGDQATCGPCQ
ncbi:MAG: hypothetical protein NTY19_05710 [Planctomycetota bacterium]|nr:hypothetical protein [Planctomycetota bacterium]